MEVLIGGLPPARFLLDTGTSRTVISQRLARRLGLRGTPDTLAAFSRTLLAERLILPRLEVGPLLVADLPVVAADLRAVGQHLGTQLDGILGMDVLGRCSFVIDFKKRRIEIHDIQTVDDEPRLGLLVLDAHLGDYPLRLLLDTGSDTVVLFAREGMRVAGPEATALQMGGQARLRRAHAATVRVGNTSINPQSVWVLDTGHQRYPYDGILGARALNASRLEVNRHQGTIGWR